jgi:hypothetical protein
MKATSVALPVALVIIAIAIPIQHCSSLRAHEEEIQRPYRSLMPGQGSGRGPIESKYPDGTRREYEYTSGFLAASRLIDASSGKTLEETTYHSETIDGRVLPVITKHTDHSLWGKTKWYVMGVVIACAVLSLIMLRAEKGGDSKPSEE